MRITHTDTKQRISVRFNVKEQKTSAVAVARLFRSSAFARIHSILHTAWPGCLFFFVLFAVLTAQNMQNFTNLLLFLQHESK